VNAIGWVVDDGCPAKQGGALAFAAALGERAEPPAGHRAACPACALLEEDLACVGMVAPKISAEAELALLRRLPDDLESLPGVLLRQYLEAAQVEGRGGAALRALGLLEAPGPLSRHWGPFFRRVTITTDQLLETLFGAGDVEPPHALALLCHLGAILVDGQPPISAEHGPRLGDLVRDPASRRAHAAIRIPAPSGDEPQAAFDRYLRGLFAGFVLDCPVRVLTPA
jgi:hypothetical protein